MGQIINIYCDESCHLENDNVEIMTIGLVTCPLEKTREIATRLREIKAKHKMKKNFEIKWNDISPNKKQFYLDILDYFFDDDDLMFRAVIAPKKDLDHLSFNQTHDDWYYKMMYQLISHVLRPKNKFRIYLDKKDTRSASKMRKLHDVLCNDILDFNHRIVERVEIVESHAVEQIQLADLLIGAIEYFNRGLTTNPVKLALIERISERSGYSLRRTTLLHEPKFNLFFWHPKIRRPSHEL